MEKKTIEFDETMISDGTWIETDSNSDDWDNCDEVKLFGYGNYDYYNCWLKGCKDSGFLFRVNKNKCSKCGRKLDD